MQRVLLFLLCLPVSASAGVFPPVPVIPQAIVEQARAQAVPPEGDGDDPAKLAERIAENTKTAGDKLKNFDTGEETRKTQDEILKDIDKLLNPPPMENNSGGGGMPPPSGGMPPPNDGGGGMPPPSGGGGMPPPNGGGMGQGSPKPMGGMGQGRDRKSFRERREQEQGGTGKPMPIGKGDKPMPMGKGDKPMPMGQPPMGDGKLMGGMNPGMGDQGTAGKGTPPGLPLDETIMKQVWGHLPEKQRQEMNQFYREQFMPKYGELLRQYYAGLAEREKDRKKR